MITREYQFNEYFYKKYLNNGKFRFRVITSINIENDMKYKFVYIFFKYNSESTFYKKILEIFILFQQKKFLLVNYLIPIAYLYDNKKKMICIMLKENIGNYWGRTNSYKLLIKHTLTRKTALQQFMVDAIDNDIYANISRQLIQHQIGN